MYGGAEVHSIEGMGTPEWRQSWRTKKMLEVRAAVGSQEALRADSGSDCWDGSIGVAANYCPVTYSTLSIAGILRAVVPQYGLDGDATCVLFNRGVSDTYLVSSEHMQFALRIYRANWRSDAAILAEIEALQHLSGKGIEVAMPVRRKDGGWITALQAPEGRRRAVLFHWISGRAPRYTQVQHGERYGELLANVHSATEDLPINESRPLMNLEYLLHIPMNKIKPRLRGRLMVAQLEELCLRIMPHLKEVEQHLGDWGFCHGDIYPNNACINNGRLTLFDFDFCGWGWRVYDLATYRWEARRQGVERVAWQPFIQAYCRIRPAAAEWLKFVGLFMILRHFWTTAHWIGLSPEHGVNFPPEDFMEDLVPFCEKIELGLQEADLST